MYYVQQPVEEAKSLHFKLGVRDKAVIAGYECEGYVVLLGTLSTHSAGHP
jgi:hypothetical protein